MNIDDLKSIEKRVEDLVERLLRGTPYVLVDVSFKGIGGRRKLEIAVDKPGGITLEECEKLSGEISLALDAEDFVPGPYILEVGSPGLDRVIKTQRELSWAKGKKVRIFLKEGEIKGVLLDFDEEFIILSSGGKIKRNDVLKIKIDEV
ncbi:MAG: ribosome maturation factor RimP [Candidatus Hydrothermia bacterium]